MAFHQTPRHKPVEWPFTDGRNTAVFTTTHVLRDGEPIMFVFHNADGDWQFHYAGTKSVSDHMIVALEEIVQHDPSISELAHLPCGWRASRTAQNAPWHREPDQSDETDDESTNVAS
jgi:hypothetical protein